MSEPRHWFFCLARTHVAAPLQLRRAWADSTSMDISSRPVKVASS